MTEAAITVENLAKKYVIAHQGKGDGLRHAIEQAVRSPLKWMRSRRQRRDARQEEFWALRGLDFEIKAGEVVGIIGRNGAGKSTLLKVLSRITDPTTGRIHMRGRVSSLLEVGTGFHPELTGRENVFLNGAILGMSRVEIVRKFDEIVAFAGIERFLDTPVKRYSSGMYVRLAFAVAAHLEPEILIVDEVLAVGDAEFQKKCLDKMDHVGSSGRTVLFVSHNMQAVTRLCSRCILLNGGQVELDGPSHQVAAAYLNLGGGAHTDREWADPATAPGDGVVRLRAVRVLTDERKSGGNFDIRRPIGVSLEYDVLQPDNQFLPHFGIRDGEGSLLFISSDCDPEWRGRKRPPGRYVSTGWIPGNFLTEGSYSISAHVTTLDPEIRRVAFRDAVIFRVVDDLFASDTARGDYTKPMPGLLRPLLRWTNNYTPADSDLTPDRLLNAPDGRE